MNRRKLIQLLTLSGMATTTIPAKWTKPVIMEAVLPTHAACSPCTPSDIRLKTNIEKLNRLESGIQLYRFDYLQDIDSQTYVGVMAQDLVDSHPDALAKDAAGYYRVRYQSLGLRLATLEEWLEKGVYSVTAH